MKYSTPKLTIPSFTFRLEVIVGIILLYLMISCLVFGSCLKVSFGSLVREGVFLATSATPGTAVTGDRITERAISALE